MRTFASFSPTPFRHIALSMVYCMAAVSAGNSYAQNSQPAKLRQAASSQRTATATNPALNQALASTAAPTAIIGATVDNNGIRPADHIVAIVNSEPITNNEVRARIQRVIQAMAEQGVQIPATAQLAPEVLERLIVEKAQIHMAKETGIKIDDYMVDQAIANVARQNSVDAATLFRELNQQGISEIRFRQEIREQLSMQRLREREVDGRINVSEQDIDQYLAEQRTKSTRGDVAAEAINLGHILVQVPDNASPSTISERQVRAEQALNALRDGMDFDSVARQYSDAGEPIMGIRPIQRYPALFVDAVASTPVGGLAGPVRSEAGFHILKVLDKSISGVPSIVTQNHARHILLRTSAQLSARQAAEQLLELRQRIERGTASFENLAQQYSQDGSAAQGGDLGWSSPGQFVPEFEQALAALQPGQISPPIVSRFGVHLIQLDERRQAALSPREQREMLRNIVREEKLDKAYTTWLQELRGQAYVEYREPAQ